MTVILAIVAVTLAFIAYSFGTWIELKRGEITATVVGLFVLGLVGDFSGTLLMVSVSGGFAGGFHPVAGLVALVLMLIKTIWVVGIRVGRIGVFPPRAYSFFAWGLWVTVYVAGFVAHG